MFSSKFYMLLLCNILGFDSFDILVLLIAISWLVIKHFSMAIEAYFFQITVGAVPASYILNKRGNAIYKKEREEKSGAQTN